MFPVSRVESECYLLSDKLCHAISGYYHLLCDKLGNVKGREIERGEKGLEASTA